MSALYYLVSSYAGPALESGEDGAAAAITACTDTLLAVLRSSCFLSRDALVSAAATLHSAACLPAAAPEQAALHFSLGLLAPPEPAALGLAGADAAAGDPQAPDGPAPLPPPLGLADRGLRERGSSLVQELRGLAPPSRLCAVKGALPAGPLLWGFIKTKARGPCGAPGPCRQGCLLGLCSYRRARLPRHAGLLGVLPDGALCASLRVRATAGAPPRRWVPLTDGIVPFVEATLQVPC